ncbi:hypothetical protein SAMN05443667_101252 [Flavobacterium gillisiae]|uniref:Magnesium transporter MgtE intracellular domain-containing protein n=1 Tax=Flavobacterium gillisiae TaxID=150146 RepID=A0A1H3WVV0_9FLAO|nr:hypothetical protein SAMN05443667_101252 [Flavobacterium gillisiae]
MAQSNITLSAGSDMELLTRKNAIDALNALTTDQLKRVLKLIKSPKAIAYLSSDIKFKTLQTFL